MRKVKGCSIFSFVFLGILLSTLITFSSVQAQVCFNPTGACCLPSGDCDIMHVNVCTAFGGTFMGIGTGCSGITCLQPEDPVGACCLPDGSCIDDISSENCSSQGGTYQGDDTECSGISCPQPEDPVGACCLPDGNCIDDISSENCNSQGGTYQGDDTECSGISCLPPQEQTGACCLPDGTCSDGITEDMCVSELDGTFQGNSVCSEVSCPQPEEPGACCLPNGQCITTIEDTCNTLDGKYHGDGTDCENFNCPPTNVQSVPTATEWGMIIMSVLFALSALFMLRRKIIK